MPLHCVCAVVFQWWETACLVLTVLEQSQREKKRNSQYGISLISKSSYTSLDIGFCILKTTKLFHSTFTDVSFFPKFEYILISKSFYFFQTIARTEKMSSKSVRCDIVLSLVWEIWAYRSFENCSIFCVGFWWSLYHFYFRYCSKYTIVATSVYCNTTEAGKKWANELQLNTTVCVQCDPFAMNKELGTRCVGHGVFGEVTRWKAVDVPYCNGMWKMKTEPSDCVCDAESKESFILIWNVKAD